MDASPDNRTRIAAAIAALLAVLALAAALFDLGPFAEDDLSVAEFLAQGDEICTDAHDSFRDNQKGAPRTPEEAAELTGALIESAREELSAIQGLDVPGSLAGSLDRYYAARERGILQLEDGLAAARKENPLGYEQAQARVSGSQAQRHRIAKKVGFSVCSKPLVGAGELERQAEPPEAADLDAPPEVNNPST